MMDPELKGILTQILHRLDGQDAKFDALEAKIDTKIDTLEAKFDSKIDTLEAKFDSKIDAMDAKFESKFDAMDAKWEKKFYLLMSEVAVIKEDITDIRGTMATKADVVELKQEVRNIDFQLEVQRKTTAQHERDILQLNTKQQHLIQVAGL